MRPLTNATGRRQRVVSLALLIAASAFGYRPLAAQNAPAPGWLQAGGPNRNFVVANAPRLADAWPETGPPQRWSRPLGMGHSAILADNGRLYTMYRPLGPNPRTFVAEEIVIAMDAATGRTLWEYKYASPLEDTSQGTGPHSTPLIVGDRLFAFGSNKQVHAFDKQTGRVIWSHDLVKDFGAPELLVRPVVKAGYGCSPIAYQDTIICFVGGPGQAVVAFRQSDGGIVWKSGDFLTSDAPPLLIRFEGEPQLVIFAGAAIHGLNPATGRVLWSHVHDPGNDFNFSMPLWGDDNILFMSSAYKMGSRAIRLKRDGERTLTEELWYVDRAKFQFLNALRVGDFVYGTSGSLGVAFLMALDVKTGAIKWQQRGFAQSSIIHADGKAILLDEDGDLALLRLAPEGATVLSRANVFKTRSWTVPTLVGTTLYARDRESIAAFDLAAQ